MGGSGQSGREGSEEVPGTVRTGFDGARRRLRRARARTSERLQHHAIGVIAVAEALRDCGLEEGDACFFQDELGDLGRFEDGAATIIEGVDKVIGPRGLVAMPSYPMTSSAFEYLSDDPVFDLRRTPSQMGIVSEAFRRDPETQRSLHPSHPVCARGRGAEALLAGHDAAPTPFGHGTPFMRLVDADALQIFFGGGLRPLSMYHPFECTRVPAFPLPVFSDRLFDARCIDADGRELVVRTLVHDPDLRAGRIDAKPKLEARFREEILRSGGLDVTIGKGEILAIRLRDLIGMFERLLDQGVTIYSEPLPGGGADHE